MGIIWTVWPLDDEMKAWLIDQGIAFPESASRFPTGTEIKRALNEMHLRTRAADNGVGGPWSATIEVGPEDEPDEWTVLIISEYSGDDEPQKLYFEKGHDTLIRAILKHLVPLSGPLVLINDVGDPPEVVAA